MLCPRGYSVQRLSEDLMGFWVGESQGATMATMATMATNVQAQIRAFQYQRGQLDIADVYPITCILVPGAAPANAPRTTLVLSCYHQASMSAYTAIAEGIQRMMLPAPATPATVTPIDEDPDASAAPRCSLFHWKADNEAIDQLAAGQNYKEVRAAWKNKVRHDRKRAVNTSDRGLDNLFSKIVSRARSGGYEKL